MPATEKTKSKSSKPLMEKRRRARINDSLMQLKSLVLDALNKNNSRHSKLEKADILEMTVRYLRTIQRQQISASVNADPAALGQYRSGYTECVSEVTRYLGSNSTNKNTDGDAPELRTRLVGHLADMCTSGQQQQTTRPASAAPQQHQSPVTLQIAQTTYQQRSDAPVAVHVTNQHAQPTSVPHQRISPAHPEGARTEYTLNSPVYNTAPRGQLSPVAQRAQSPTNSYQMIQSVGVAGSLPSGEITLVLPQQALPNGQLPTHLIPVYAPPAVGSTVLSPTPATNCATNIPPSTTATPCHVSMSSPRAAATVPTMSPTGPQPSMTIPAQHALVAQTTSAQVAYRVPVQQTNISPVREFGHQMRIELARAELIPASATNKTDDPMWRPW